MPHLHCLPQGKVASSEILEQGMDEVRLLNVPKRRGRCQNAKRKISDQGAPDQDHPSKREDGPAMVSQSVQYYSCFFCL